MTTPEGVKSEKYERRDLNIRGIVIFLVVLAVILVAVLAGMDRMFEAFAEKRPLSPSERIEATPERPLPKGYDLRSPISEVRRRVAAEEERHLGRLGWVDREKGIAQIPIDRAIEIIAREGLPARNPGAEGRH